MKDNITQIKPCANASVALRNIADMMESGIISATECTLIAGTKVFHVGTFDDERAAESAIFNMTMGIQKLMKPVIDADEIHE